MIDAPRILYESPSTLVVLKPAALATQAPAEFDSLEKRLRAWLQEREGSAEAVYLGVPHRLDRPVSGAMVFAKTRPAARKISRQFERRQVRKTYWACVTGVVAPAEGTWTDHLRKVYGHPRTEIVPADHPEAQLAVLHYRTLGTFDWGSWLEIELETGRTHQVRIQAATRGHAVLGDAFYSSTVPFGPTSDDPRAAVIALHARSLELRDPDTQQTIEITAPVSDDWESLAPGVFTRD